MFFDDASMASTIRLAVFGVTFLLLAKLVVFALSPGATTVNYLTTPLVLVVVVVSYGLVRLGRATLGAALLVWGLLIVVIGLSLFSAGTQSTALLLIPLPVLVAGLLIGQRNAVLLALTAIASLLVIALAETYHWVPMPGNGPIIGRWLSQTIILAMTLTVTCWATTLYQARYEKLHFVATELRLVTESSPVMLASIDNDGRLRYVNGQFAAFVGRPAEALIGQSVFLLLDEATVEKTRQALQQNGHRGRYRSRQENRATREQRWIETEFVAGKGEDGEADGYYVIQRDITEQVLAERRVEFMAFHDELTGLPNRSLFSDRLHQAMAAVERNGETLAVCYLDLDGFKQINDRWGHPVGDLVLIEVARRINACVRSGDTVARLGGDEFAVLLVGLPEGEQMFESIGRILAALETPLHNLPAETAVSGSIGAALYPRDGQDAETLLHKADQAMLVAKQQGKSRFVLFDKSLEERVRSNQEIHARIADGLDNDELVLLFQPKVDMRDGTVTGAEALLRWRQANGAMMPPAQFLPSIESSDLAIAVDRWVLTTALAQRACWARADLVLPVSVNVSTRLLLHPGFMTMLVGLLEGDGCGLELEIRESSATVDLDHVARVIVCGQELGVRFALDDFGGGLSSLRHLRQLPADVLNIDAAFVGAMHHDAACRAVVECVVAMGRSFDRAIVAKGVESLDIGRQLIGLGCTTAQGYVIARPMPGDDLPAWVQRWQTPLAWDDRQTSLLRA